MASLKSFAGNFCNEADAAINAVGRAFAGGSDFCFCEVQAHQGIRSDNKFRSERLV